MNETPDTRPTLLPAWIAGALVVVIALQVFASWQTRSALELLDATAARLEKAAIDTEEVGKRVAVLDERVQRVEGRLVDLQVLGDEWEFLVDDVQKMSHRVDDLVTALEGREGLDVDATPQPAELDWTQPDLFAAAQRAAASVGITLTADEVRVPARLILVEGVLEYFAVLKGGKEHEALLSLVGNLGREERRPPEFGAKLNNAIQALGFRRGRPIRFSAAGTRPAEGQTVYLFVEWQEGEETVVVRAEDLVWDRIRDCPMPRDCWVYVGSSWVEGDRAGELLFAADLTAEAVATYSAPNTIIDTRAEGAQDDTVFLVATPRIPEGVRECTFVIRRVDREPTRTFPDPRGAGAAAPADDGGSGGDE